MAASVHGIPPVDGGLNVQDPDYVIWRMVFENCVRNAEAKALERSIKTRR